MRNKVAKMKPVKLENAFLMIEKGPVVLISTSCRGKNNIMPLSWITVIDFTPRFALCTGSWNYSYEALVKTKECVIAIPGVDLIDKPAMSAAQTPINSRFADLKQLLQNSYRLPL